MVHAGTVAQTPQTLLCKVAARCAHVHTNDGWTRSDGRRHRCPRVAAESGKV